MIPDWNYACSVITVRFFWALIRCMASMLRYRIQIPESKRLIFSGALDNADDSLLFIMGSGSSLNYLGPDDWAFVSEHGSIGVNDLIIHPMSFRCVALEVFHDESKFYDRVQRYAERARVNRNFPLLTLKAVASKRVIRVLRSTLSDGALNGLERHVHLHFPLTIRARTTTELFAYWRLYEGFVPKFLKPSIFLNQSSTVVRMVMGSLNSNASQIVVMGVDLGGPYFWEQADFKEPASSWEHGEGPHVSNLEEFNIERILEGLENQLESSTGKRLIWLRKEDLASGKSLRKLIQEKSQ